MLHFIGIGAQKAGTTWLYQILRQHPGIGFPLGKESHYWNAIQGARDEQAERQYLSYFTDPNLIEGEITPAYSVLDADAITCLHRAAPDLRLILIMRNPLERAWSAALMYMRQLDMDFSEATDAWFSAIFHSRASQCRGDYAKTIQRWTRVFAPKALLTLRYEQLGTDPDDIINTCLAHLGLDPLSPDELVRMGSRQRVFAGVAQTPRLGLWQLLQQLYQDRLLELEQLLHADFSNWLEPPTLDSEIPGRHPGEKRYGD